MSVFDKQSRTIFYAQYFKNIEGVYKMVLEIVPPLAIKQYLFYILFHFPQMDKEQQERDYVISGSFINNPFPVNECNSTIKFDSLEFKKKIELGIYDPTKDPKYCIVYPGLNLQGTCENQKCRGYHQRVWVKKQFGKFGLGQMRTKNKCPDCEKNMISKSFRGLGYTRAQVEFDGIKIVDGKEVEFKQKDVENEGKFIKFDGADENIVEWEYLNITVTQVKVPGKRS